MSAGYAPAHLSDRVNKVNAFNDKIPCRSVQAAGHHLLTMGTVVNGELADVAPTWRGYLGPDARRVQEVAAASDSVLRRNG